MMHKSGELLKRCEPHQGLQVRTLVVFDAEKRLRQFFRELPQFFVVPVAWKSFPLLPVIAPPGQHRGKDITN